MKMLSTVFALMMTASSVSAASPTIEQIVVSNEGMFHGKLAWTKKHCFLRGDAATADWPASLSFDAADMVVSVDADSTDWSLNPKTNKLTFDSKSEVGRVRVVFSYNPVTLKITRYAVTAGDVCVLR